jgi:EmrB/QacA subfamily drug resistance transporter
MRKDEKSNSPTTKTPTKAVSSKHGLVLTLLVLAQFMVIVDFMIVQVALPSIGKEFGISINVLQWTVTAYGLTLAGFLMLSGRLGDMYGHKKLFIIGVLLFSLASLMGGLAPSDTVLILARATQGLGAAMASAAGLSILVTVFSEGKERNRALSIFAAVTGLGSASGMILGGVITATLGWRWVFEINLPIGIALSLISIKYISLTSRRANENRHLDILGAISITAGLMLLVYSLSIAQNNGIESPQALEFIMLSLIVITAFFLIEYRSKLPLMPLDFLKRGSIFSANALALIQMGAFVAMTFILTNYFQQILGYSALSTGIAFLPVSIVFLIISGFLSSRLVNRFGVKPILILGMALQTVGYLFLSRISITESYFSILLAPMFLIGFGTGFGFTAINIAGLQGTRKGEEGLASGLINTSRQIGGPIGLAVLLTVANFATPYPTGQLMQSAVVMVIGFGHAFLAAALLTGIGIIFAFLLKQQKQQQNEDKIKSLEVIEIKSLSKA